MTVLAYVLDETQFYEEVKLNCADLLMTRKYSGKIPGVKSCVEWNKKKTMSKHEDITCR